MRDLATSPVDLNGDGLPDVTTRNWYFTYDPRFGSGAEYGRVKVQFHWDRSGKGDDDSRMYVNPRSIARQQYFFNEHTRSSHGNENPESSNCPNLLAIQRWRFPAVEMICQWNPWAARQCMIGFNPVLMESFPLATAWRLIQRALGPTHAPEYTPGLPPPRILRSTDGTAVAINTKGTGADKNRTAGGGSEGSWPWDGDLDFNDFCVSATDPRGNVTTAACDMNGNVIHVEKDMVCMLNIIPFRSSDFVFIIPMGSWPPSPTFRTPTVTPAWIFTLSYYTNGPQAGYLQSCVEDANGLALTTAFEYDAHGNVTRCIDPRANDWLFTYNALDECVQSQSALLGGGGASWRIASQYFYDANDNLVQSSIQLRDVFGNQQGSRTDNFSYDGLDRLSQIALAVDASHALTNRFIYDGNNQCVQMLGGDAVSGADPYQTMVCQYDERGLLFRAMAAPGAMLAGTNEFSYSPNGNPASRKFEDESGVVLELETCAYDGFDRVAAAADAMGNQTVCFYDANDNLKDVRLLGETNDVPGSAGNVRLAGIELRLRRL